VKDADALRAIRLEALADAPGAFGETFEECSQWSEQTWATKAEEWNFYLAECDGRVVGMARGECHDDRPDTRWLFAMFVSREFRGGEAARLLLERVCAWAAAQGVEHLYLYVSNAVPRARAFYKKVGFVETGPHVTMYRDEALVCDEMRRDLSDITFHAHRVAPHVLYDLRRRVLRDADPLVDVRNVNDDLETTLHYGGFLGEQVVVSASLFAAAMPHSSQTPAYQLRYMATDFDVQGRGLGSRLLSQVLDDLSRRGISRVWANARTSAVDFYVAAGWRVVEDSWHISAETGIAHVVIERSLDPQSLVP
jgi:GNAT superfamily N-acetyltransferase